MGRVTVGAGGIVAQGVRGADSAATGAAGGRRGHHPRWARGRRVARQAGRTASSATHSPSVQRRRMLEAARREGADDVGLAVLEDARGEQRAAGPQVADQAVDEGDEQRRDEVGEDDVERPLAARGTPRAGPDRCGRAGCAGRWPRSRRRRSGPRRPPAPRARPAGPQRATRIPDPDPTSSTRAGPPPALPPARSPRSASDSSAARHSRVVGWRPVPNAIPGSSASTTSSGCRRWRRQVGRITIRRPTRSTGKCAFQAFAQSASRTMLADRSPIGRSPNACRWPRSRSARSTASRTASTSRSGRCARTSAGRAKSTRAASPSSTSSNAGSTDVPPGAARARISDTASTASWSAATESSSHAPGVAAAAARSRPASGPAELEAPRGRRRPGDGGAPGDGGVPGAPGTRVRHYRPSFSRRPCGAETVSPPSFANSSSSSRWRLLEPASGRRRWR